MDGLAYYYQGDPPCLDHKPEPWELEPEFPPFELALALWGVAWD